MVTAWLLIIPITKYDKNYILSIKIWINQYHPSRVASIFPLFFFDVNNLLDNFGQYHNLVSKKNIIKLQASSSKQSIISDLTFDFKQTVT